MSPIAKQIREFEGSDDLGNGDFSICEQAADLIESQAARIAELERSESALEDAIIMADRYFDGDSDHADCTARLVASVVRMGTRIAELEDRLRNWLDTYDHGGSMMIQASLSRDLLNEKGEG